jgi:tetratricopeptide (TPR) repeat protein
VQQLGFGELERYFCDMTTLDDGILHLLRGQYGKAVGLFSNETQTEAALFQKAICYQCLGQHEEATRDFTRVLETKPMHARAYFRRGLSLRLMGHYAAAADDFLTAHEIEPDRGEFVIDFKKPNEALFGFIAGDHFRDIVCDKFTASYSIPHSLRSMT